MQRKLALLLLLSSFLLNAEDLGVRILLGLTDTSSTSWSGSVTAQEAAISGIEPWRFEGSDAILTGNSWNCQTHPGRFQGTGTMPVVANGVIVRLKDGDSAASISVSTVQGSFTIALSEIPFGASVKKLDDRVMVDRIPTVSQLTTGTGEQDYPAMAARNGEAWLAWVDFTHSAVHDKLRTEFNAAPANFDLWASRPGGDRIWTRQYANGAWSVPVAITNGAEDLGRPAVAIDGQGNAWVIWSAQYGGNFDLWARSISAGKAQNLVRITSEPGSDIDPVAATDSNGRVWIAWQGWRDGRASIFAVRQNGTGFTAPELVASSQRNEWNPAIAADTAGRVTVVWDSYRNGNYDVYMRTAQDGAWGAETPVAASARYEAYATAAYEPNGRLWVAYEEGAERWGKDWGAMETSGVALCLGRAVRLRGFETNGQSVETNVDVATVLPGLPNKKADIIGSQAEIADDWYLPQTRPRTPKQASPFAAAPRNSSPRLHVDASGRMWLAIRSSHPAWFNPSPIGTVWSEYVLSYDGEQWTRPVYLSQSDNILDNRPALASISPGRLLVVGSSDWRRQYYLAQKFPPARGKTVTDPYNNDLFANEILLTPGRGSLDVRSMAPPQLAAADPEDAIERNAIDRVHAARPLGKYKDSHRRVSPPQRAIL